jgi:hypothetical protein
MSKYPPKHTQRYITMMIIDRGALYFNKGNPDSLSSLITNTEARHGGSRLGSRDGYLGAYSYDDLKYY